MIVKIKNDNLNGVLDGDGIVIFYFKAEWCGPCRMYSTIINTFAEENEDVVVGKVDVDNENEVAAKYGIRSIPTTIVFKNGEVVNRLAGVVQKDKLVEVTKL